VHRILGYGLSACVKDRSFYDFFGKGSNGKTHLMNLMAAVLGEKGDDGFLLMGVSGILFQTGKKSSANEQNGHVAQMNGMRMVCLDESSKGAELDDSQMKRLTGGTPISARDLHEKLAVFLPTFKIYVSNNDPPLMTTIDAAVIDRTKAPEVWTRYWTDAMQLKPDPEHQDKAEFTDPKTGVHWVKITQETEQFYEKLKTVHLNEFFLWLCMGCFEALQMISETGRIYVPKIIKADTMKFLDFHDPLKQFLELIEPAIGPNLPLTARDAHDIYVDLCVFHNQKTYLGEKNFLRRLEDRGLYDKTKVNGNYYVKFYIPESKKPESRRGGLERKNAAQLYYDRLQAEKAQKIEEEKKATKEREKKHQKAEREAKAEGNQTLNSFVHHPAFLPAKESKKEEKKTAPMFHAKTQEELELEKEIANETEIMQEIQDIPNEFLFQ
jgi:hypothetical protein